MAWTLSGDPPPPAGARIIDAIAAGSLYWCQPPLRPSYDAQVMLIVPVVTGAVGARVSKSSSVMNPPLPIEVPQLRSVHDIGEQRPRSGPVYGWPFDPHAMLLPEPPAPPVPEPVPPMPAVVEGVPPAEPVLVVVAPPPAPLVVLPLVVVPLDVVPLEVVPVVPVPAPPAPELVSPPVPVRDEPPLVSLHA